MILLCRSNVHRQACLSPTTDLWAIVDQACVRRLLGDARVLVLPAVEFPFCTAVHEVSRTVSYECLCARCAATEPNGTAFLTSSACAQQAGPENVFHVNPKKIITLQTGHQLFVLLFGFLSCLVLVAFNVPRRRNGKNHEIKEEPWRLRCGAQKVHDALMKQIVKENCGATVILLFTWRTHKCQVTKLSSVGTESVFDVTRDCKAVVCTTPNSRRTCNSCCRV